MDAPPDVTLGQRDYAEVVGALVTVRLQDVGTSAI
jgi:hypothetical protein